MIDQSDIPPPATATPGKHVRSRLNVLLIPTLPSTATTTLFSPQPSLPYPHLNRSITNAPPSCCCSG